MQRRPYGTAGDELSIIGFGGIVIKGMAQDSADRLVAEAIDRGVNYFDIAPSYGDAEQRMGAALEGKRDRVFLACKTAERNADAAQADLETSLQRLRSDHFDLYQLHGLATMDELETAMSPNGALTVLIEAKERGLVRFLGFSAHTVEVALEAMNRFQFDSVLFPVNFVHYAINFGPQVVEEAQKRGISRLALKAMARRPWPENKEHTAPNCWYEPFADHKMIDLALRYTLSEPVTSAIPPGDPHLYRIALNVAESYRPLEEGERAYLKKIAAKLQPLFKCAA